MDFWNVANPWTTTASFVITNSWAIIVIWALILNCLTCTVVRFIKGGRLIRITPNTKPTPTNRPKIVPSTEPAKSPNRPKIYLISGLKSQPDKSYAKIDFDGYDRVLLKFSLLGYNPVLAGRQLSRMMRPEDVACAVSLGAQTIEYARMHRDCRSVLINPCSHSEIYQENRSRHPKLRRLSPLFVTITFLMGWVAVLPLLPADMGDRTSLALLMDQVFWMDYGSPDLRSDAKVGVVVSTQDEVLSNPGLYALYRGARFVEIDTPHGRIGSSRYAKDYERAIAELLDQISA